MLGEPTIAGLILCFGHPLSIYFCSDLAREGEERAQLSRVGVIGVLRCCGRIEGSQKKHLAIQPLFAPLRVFVRR
jgi:hypothetical protein